MQKSEYRNAVYVTDLDGTLICEDEKVPEESVKKLNALAEKGIKITYATARTEKTVSKILASCPKKVPLSLMNGVITMNLDTGERMKVRGITKKNHREIKKLFRKEGLASFAYYIEDNELKATYDRVDNDNMAYFIERRVTKYNKKFEQYDRLDCPGKTPIYLMAIDRKERLEKIKPAIDRLKGIKTVIYEEPYIKDMWYFEIFSSEASKSRFVNDLREMYPGCRIICFGDNLNDIPLFEKADEGYAVKRANPKLKEISAGLIDNPEENGVAEFIEKMTR